MNIGVTVSDGNGYEGYLTVDELADEVKVSVRTVRRWLAETDIPHRRVGTVVRFKLAEVDEWMQSRQSEPAETEVA